MDLATSTRVISNTKALSRQSLPKKNSKLILMPWEKRHQHTLTSFVRKNSKCENFTENGEHHNDRLVTQETRFNTGNGEVYVKDHCEKDVEDYEKRSANYEQFVKKNSCNYVNDNVRNFDEISVDNVRMPNGTQESNFNILNPKVKKCCADNGEASGYTANKLDVFSSTSCDLDLEEAAGQRVNDTCAVVNKNEFDAVLNKALLSSGKYCLDEIFKCDDGEDKDLLWQALDIRALKSKNPEPK